MQLAFSGKTKFVILGIIAGYLIAKGADVTITDYAKLTPLAHASNRGLVDIVSFLEKHGAR